MKKPLDPEDVVEALRERFKKEDLTLTASEAGRIIWMLERLSQRCAEAYEVVGSSGMWWRSLSHSRRRQMARHVRAWSGLIAINRRERLGRPSFAIPAAKQIKKLVFSIR